MDAKEASTIALSYFRSLGSGGPIGFTIESADSVEGILFDDKVWVVKCSLWDYMGAPQRSTYELKIDNSAKTILKVIKVDDQCTCQ
ncbi:MAG: hypothetical protein WC749_12775 [Dehalococcoidia bacterium]